MKLSSPSLEELSLPFHGVSLLPTTGLLAQPKWEGDTTVYVLILP